MIANKDALATNLPLGWRLDRLKDVVSLRTVKTDEPSETENYVELEDIESGTGRLLNRRTTLEVVSAVTLFQSGDVLFGKLRPYLEKYYQADFDGRCTGEILAFKPERVDAAFLRNCIASPDFIGRCSELAYGAKMPRVNWPTQLAQFYLPLPTLPEQKRIAQYLDASSRAIEAAVAVKLEQIEALDQVRKATLQRLITRGLGLKPRLTSKRNHWLSQVPAGWNLVMLKRVANIQGGLTLGKVYDGPLIERPYLRVANVQDGHFDLDDITMIEVPADVAARVTLCVGDVLMTEGGDLDKLGRGHVWDGEIADCLHQNHVFAVRCIEWKLRPKFLAYVTASQLGRDYFEATGKRTTNLAATNSTKVGQLPVPLPPLDEQDKIIAHLDDVTDKFKSLRSALLEQITTLVAYRKSLIHECVTGQRRITPADIARVQTHA